MTGRLLAVDAGNSQIEVGLTSDSEPGWLARWRLETKANRTVDEYGVTIARLLEGAGVELSDIGGVVLSSVVPSLTPVLEGVSRRLFGVEPLVVTPAAALGIDVLYDPPSAAGSDRIVDAIAARDRFGAPVVVVDFGTATTFNVVDRNGRFVGGAIAPGLGVAASALARSGAKLSRIDLEPASGMPVVGRDTTQSMRSGVLYGYAGLVEGILARIDEELDDGSGSRPVVVATGGLSQVVAPLVGRFDAVVPGLTLDGLRLVFEARAT
ncbi:MAG: type III pantothenate kinase [Anaerolineae bacterium]